MNRLNDSIWPAVLFFGTWWAVSYYDFFEHYAFFWTLGLWFTGWLAIRMLGGAAHRLGFRGWLLILQLAVGYGLFLQFVPRETITKLLLLWGVATPLVLIGSVWRRTYERFPLIRRVMKGAVFALTGAACVAVPALAWTNSADFLAELAAAGAASGSGGILLYYGWRLAEPALSGTYDARFGTQESFQQAGISDER